jgi:hypothetical protein
VNECSEIAQRFKVHLKKGYAKIKLPTKYDRNISTLVKQQLIFIQGF